MPEQTDQEKMERRRQKRQQKILSSAGDRLSRITGTAYPLRASPTPSPSTSASSLARSETPLQEPTAVHSRSPSPAISARTPSTSDNLRARNQSTASHLSPQHQPYHDDPSEELGAPPPLDPFDMFSAMVSGQSANDAPSADMNDFFKNSGLPFNPALLASMAGVNGGSATASSSSSTLSMEDNSLKYWNLLHLLTMLCLGIYAVYMEWVTGGMTRMAQLLQATSNDNIYGLTHAGAFVPLFWYFATIELCLQSARMFYQKGSMATNSTLGTLATQLPPPLNNIVTICLRYRLIWSCLVQDCCVLVFIVGFAEVLSALFV